VSVRPGDRLGQIGQGGAGEVIQATDTSLGPEAAVQVLPQAGVQGADRVARFARDANTLANGS